MLFTLLFDCIYPRALFSHVTLFSESADFSSTIYYFLFLISEYFGDCCLYWFWKRTQFPIKNFVNDNKKLDGFRDSFKKV